MNIQQFHRACVESNSTDPTLAALRRLRDAQDSSATFGWFIWPATDERSAVALSDWEPWSRREPAAS